MSHLIAYGHSLATIKNVKSVSLMLDQFVVSLAWAQLLPGVKYSGGAFQKKSKFTTRVYVSFQTQTSPNRQWIVHAQRVFGSLGSDRSPNGTIVDAKFTVGPTENFPHEQLKPRVSRFITMLESPHRIATDFHAVRRYSVVESNTGRLVAVLIDHSSARYLTASDVFQYAWLVVIDVSSSIRELVMQLRANNEFSKKTIQVIYEDGQEVPPECNIGVEESPTFWTFTPNDELGPVVASIHRSVYAVLKKYGEEAMTEMARMF